jgi:hypothetical protein
MNYKNVGNTIVTTVDIDLIIQLRFCTRSIRSRFFVGVINSLIFLNQTLIDCYGQI